MNIRVSKEFEKSAKKLSGKYKETLKQTILEIKFAQSLNEITDCKKLVGFNSVYRVRMGYYRLFFIFEIVENTVFLKYLVSRGEAYQKSNLDILRKFD